MTMKLTFVLLLFGAVAVMGKPTQNDEDRCAVKHTYLVDCGWMGINQETCEARSCCWNSSVPEGSPWCYQAKDSPPPTCIVDPTKTKIDCGWLGINQEQCEARGCCWKENVPQGEPWCYLKDFDVPPYAMCPVGPSQRDDCGKVGTTKEECLGDSCCWDDTIQNTAYCFHQPEVQPPKGCYIGVYGDCKYVCDPGQSKAYGLCGRGMLYCCYENTIGRK